MAVIRTAYARGKHGYRARAFVEDRGVRHTHVIGLGDTADEATQEAVRHIRETHIREGLTPPQEIERIGRVIGALLDAWIF